MFALNYYDKIFAKSQHYLPKSNYLSIFAKVMIFNHSLVHNEHIQNTNVSEPSGVINRSKSICMILANK